MKVTSAARAGVVASTRYLEMSKKIDRLQHSLYLEPEKANVGQDFRPCKLQFCDERVELRLTVVKNTVSRVPRGKNTLLPMETNQAIALTPNTRACIIKFESKRECVAAKDTFLYQQGS